MEELDALVNQRTIELREANARLTDEVAERRRRRGRPCAQFEERFSKAFHGSPVPMVIQRPDGSDCLDANASFLDLVGATREAVLAGSAQWWSDPTTASACSTMHSLGGARPRARGAASGRAAGDVREVLVSAENLALASVSYHLLIVQDITDRVRLRK